MKKFIRTTGLFFVTCLALVLVFNYAVDRLVSNEKYYPLQPAKPYLILGHSHPACAYNDSLIDGVQNLSHAMEGYFYTYFKLKTLIQSKQNIKGVFLDFSNDQLNSFGNQRIYGNYLSSLLPKYSSVIDFKGLIFLFSKKPAETLQSLNTSLWKKASFCFHDERNFIKAMDWGGYTYTTHITDGKDEASIKKVNGKAIIEYDQSISETNLEYLRKIIDLCKSNQIQIYLIRTPLFYMPIESTNEELFKSTLQNKFADVPFLDFNAFKLIQNDFADKDHLNTYGSRKISLFFNQLMDSLSAHHTLTQEEVDKLILQKED